MTKKHRLLLGAHISVHGGMHQAFSRAESIGCSTMQIFSKSNRSWFAKPIPQEDERLFKEAQKKSPVHPVLVHSSYLINLASPNKETFEKSLHALKDEIARCEQLNIPYLVLHPGSKLNSSDQEAIQSIAHGLDKALGASKGTTMILLENMAGQGSSVCSTFEQIALIIKSTDHKNRLGVCFDTCHAFAAGYSFSTPDAYQKMWTEFDATVGLNKLKAIHLNDSKKERGSRVDRHEEIGKGFIGLKAFELFINDQTLFDVPKILETPHDDLENYAQNMRVLKGLLSENNKKLLEFE